MAKKRSKLHINCPTCSCEHPYQEPKENKAPEVSNTLYNFGVFLVMVAMAALAIYLLASGG